MTTSSRLALLAGLAALAFGLSRLDAAAPTWDLAHGEYAYGPSLFEWVTTGDARHLDAGWRARAVPVREPSPDWSPAVPLAGISTPAAVLAGASLRVVWTAWGLSTPTGALLLPAVLAAALLVVVVVRLAADAAGALGGVAAAVALLAAPRVVGAAGVDLRDLPATALTMFALLVALAPRRRRAATVVAPRRRLDDASRRKVRAVVIGAALGLAVAWRATSLVWLVVVPLVARTNPAARARPRVWFVALGVGATVAWLASPDLWLHPAEVLADRVAWRASTPPPSGPGALALFVVTTPLPLLALALAGLAVTRVTARTRLALLVAVVVPLAGATSAPAWWPADVAVVDAAVPGAVLAAFGVVGLRDIWTRFVARGAASAAVGAVLALLLLAPGVATTVSAWPHAALSFGHLGLGEAQRRGWGTASDDGATTRAALRWLDDHAEPGADVLVLGGDRVASFAAPRRPDLDLVGPRGLRPDPPPPLYVVVPRRAGRSGATAAAARSVGALAHARQLEGAIVSEVWRVDDALAARALVDAWRAEVTAPRAAARAVLADAALDPSAAETLTAWLADADGPRALLGLRALAPESARPRIDAAIRAGMPGN